MPGRLYFCRLDAQGKPIIPAIDSVDILLNDTLPKIFGGDFAKPHKVTGDFAVCIRNTSGVPGDTLDVYHTASRTYTAWPGFTWQEKYSDSYGFIRYNAAFYSATNFNLAPGFGPNTDFEFFIAPRVKYTLVAREIWPQSVIDNDVICTHAPITFMSFTENGIQAWRLLLRNL
jgi:hypothetical protein